MRIESIEIENFRQYRKEKFSFPKIQGKKDIHVIIGENGEGKTNILNALTWCLYGEELHLGDKNTAISNINSQYVDELRKHGKKNGEAKVTVIMAIEDGSKITFMRTVNYSITQSNVRDNGQDVMALIPGETGVKIIEKESDYSMLVSRYVPKEINEYIFFDGELMDQYFKTEQRDNIETGIKDLTKATTIEKTKNALLSYAKNEIAPVLKNNGDKKVRDAQTNLEIIQNALNQQIEKVAFIKQEITKTENEIQLLTAKIHGFDNLKEKTDKLANLEDESDRLKKQQKQLNDDMMGYVRKNYIYFALYPTLRDFRNYINNQEDKGNLPPKIDRRLVESIINSKKCAVCGCDLNTEHLQHVLGILRKLEVSSATSAALNRASSALTSFFDIIKNYPKEKARFIRSRKNLKEQIDRNEEEYKVLSEELKNIPNQAEISKAIVDREYYRNTLNELREKLGREKHILEVRERKVKNATNELNDAMRSNKLMDIYRKQLDFCSKGVLVLDETLKEIIKECREEMQVETFNIFNKLIWKENAFSKVNILEDYSFDNSSLKINISA